MGVVENYIGNVPAWILLVCVVIISPVFEELLFRKVLLEELLPYGKVTAILISSMLFGLSHANLEQFLYTIFMGIVCANIVLITGKVRYAIYLHMAFNLFGAIISGYIPSERYTILTEIIFVISAAIIVILKAKTVFIIKDEANVNKFNYWLCGNGCRYWRRSRIWARCSDWRRCRYYSWNMVKNLKIFNVTICNINSGKWNFGYYV